MSEMPITADQTAVLEMLLVGGQSFDDLDDLFGLEAGETRVRARAALEELGGSDPDASVALTDYLLGQADPIDRADAVRHLRQDADDRALATTLVEELDRRFPGAELPSLPDAGGARRQSRARKPLPPGPNATVETRGPSVADRLARWSAGLDKGRAQLIVGLGAAAVVLIVIVLAVSGAFGGDDDPQANSGDSQAAASDDASSPLPDGQEVTRVALVPEGGSDAAGAAIVGITTNDQPYLDLVIENLEPASGERTYIAWFMFDDNTGYPIPNPIVPGRDGSYENRVPIPVEVSGAIARSTAIEISLSEANDLASSIEEAIDANEIAIERPGRTILRGDVPREPTGSGQGDQQAPGEGG